MSWSPSQDLPDVQRVGFVLELLANMVRRVGTGLTELLADRFAMQCNKKFNEMRSPAFRTHKSSRRETSHN